MGKGLIGSGKIKVALYDPTVPFEKRKFRDVMNASKLGYSFSEDKQQQPDYRSEAGGNYDAYTRISEVRLDIELLEFLAENLAMVLWGEATAQSAAAITGEEHKINAGAFIPTNRLIDTSVAPVVKKGSTTIDEDDYVVSPGGITIASTITTEGVSAGDTITIGYTPQASYDIQAMINTAPEVSLFFEGFNRNTGKYRTARFYRVKLGVASSVENIGTNYVNLPVTGEVIKDETITGEGLSQYFALEEAL
jgi:hypothetical protein